MNESQAKRETRDMKAPLVLGFFASLGVTIVIVALVARGLMALYAQHRPHEALPPVTSSLAPALGPKLQVKPTLALQELHDREEAVLNSYGWVDPARGIVRIPIDRAIDLAAQRGWPGATNTNAAGVK